MEQPRQNAIRYKNLILSETAWSSNELLDSLYGKLSHHFKLLQLINSYLFVDVKIENIEEFIEKFFSQMFMEILVYGNIEKSVSHIILYIMYINSSYMLCYYIITY